MNKQQLANKIWESANKLRSKIEANEYKDYILGFIFYKFLSDQEEIWCRKNDFTEEDIRALSEDNVEIRKYIQDNLGFFIAYDNLYSTWLAKGNAFDVSNVTVALSAFGRLINDTYRKVFSGIFQTLETGLTKLGENTSAQTKAISSLLQLIKDIPMDGRQDYDVLGFIYEYLISQFAANAGKKAGEFYTPHEVAQFMSEIVAEHLKNRSSIDIYDPTSGSGSLLLNIGKAVARRLGNSDTIKYYAQELRENTFNLTRMNLVMRGIKPGNIEVRNGDTLEEDWPWFDESNRIDTYKLQQVDAVVSNPPYSQHWDPTNKENDPRFSSFGMAPKSKADFAFLLHDLYHLKPDGIMTIVLPHGVLFRGNEEGQIRKNLIEGNHIDAIIGLPANIFFGTGIPTIVMVLRKVRENTDILLVDASQGFVKDGTKNRLRASDIRRISDTVINRLEVPGYSRRVSQDEVRANDYNLNIPRYIENKQSSENWDIYSIMFGGIPKGEIDALDNYFNEFSGLKETLFSYHEHNASLTVDDIHAAIFNHPSVQGFIQQFNEAFADFSDYLKGRLLKQTDEIPLLKEEDILAENILGRMKNLPLLDFYNAYQLLDEQWRIISTDIEIIQTEGRDSLRKVDPNMVVKKKEGKEVEVQEGWLGRIMPFHLGQELLLSAKLEELNANETRLAEIASTLTSLIDSLSEEDKESSILNNDNTAFVAKEVEAKLDELLADVESPEISVLREYLSISKKKEKQAFIEGHSEISWERMTAGKDGTYGKPAVTALIGQFQRETHFPEDSLEAILIQANDLMAEEKELKKKSKEQSDKLHAETKVVIENLTDEQINQLLEAKWIVPLVKQLEQLPITLVEELVASVKDLSCKYQATLSDISHDISQSEQSLSEMLNELTGSTEDLLGIQELKNLMGEN